MHYSAERLDWLAAHREHPVDGVLTQLAQNLPAMALGVPFEVLAVLIVFRGSWSILIYSNVRLPLGPLRVLFGAPDLHHFHHARVERTHTTSPISHPGSICCSAPIIDRPKPRRIRSGSASRGQKGIWRSSCSRFAVSLRH